MREREEKGGEALRWTARGDDRCVFSDSVRLLKIWAVGVSKPVFVTNESDLLDKWRLDELKNTSETPATEHLAKLRRVCVCKCLIVIALVLRLYCHHQRPFSPASSDYQILQQSCLWPGCDDTCSPSIFFYKKPHMRRELLRYLLL